jgi:membrane protein YdbS with pleckstrin-like domain
MDLTGRAGVDPAFLGSSGPLRLVERYLPTARSESEIGSSMKNSRHNLHSLALAILGYDGWLEYEATMSETNQEQLLFKGSSSPLINVGTFVLCGLIAAGAAAGAVILPEPLMRFSLLGLAVVALAFIVVRWLLIKVRVYEVTTERIRISDGLVTRRTDELELYRVKDTTLIEPLSMRMFSLGDIEITTHDVSTPVLRMHAIKGARELREQLRKAIETCRDKKRVRLAELE